MDGQRLLAALRSLLWGAGFVAIWVWLAFVVEPLDPRIPFTIPGWLRPVGWLLAALGIALDLWCIAHFVLQGRGTPAPFDPPREFVATGPFRYVRNPMYLGAATTILGFGLAAASPGIVLLSAAFLLWAHLFVVLYEEKTLETRFGESYLEYRRRVRRWWPRPAGGLTSSLLWVATLTFLTACAGPQSTLAPAGVDAERIATLFWWMLGGAGFVWAAVIGTAVYAVRVRPGAHSERTANWLIVGGGVVFPTVVLAVLLSYGLWLMPRLGPALGQAAVYAADAGAVPTTGWSSVASSGPSAPWPAALSTKPLPDALRIQVSGEQWWWRVRYVPPAGEPFELANELRLPVGGRAVLELVSPDVVHSFWVPSLGGKMDMIPGRVNRTVLEPTRTGVFRGVCAEYCGTAHALMAFEVVVSEPDDFAAWMERQRAPAAPVSDPAARTIVQQGARLFLANGCGACHAVRGTPADGRVGPDLTHVGSRRTLGAGTLSNGPTDFRRWLARTEHVKPGVHMPSFRMLRDGELDALAAYLESLR